MVISLRKEIKIDKLTILNAVDVKTYRSFFSRSRESSSSSRVCSSLAFTLFKWLTLSSAAWKERY